MASEAPDVSLGFAEELLTGYEAPERLRLMGAAAVQRETAEALSAVVELQREQHAVMNELLSRPEWEAPVAQEPTAGLVAQAHQARLQSSRLIARAQELAARAEQLTVQAQQAVNDVKVSVLERRTRDRVLSARARVVRVTSRAPEAGNAFGHWCPKAGKSPQIADSVGAVTAPR